MTDGQRSFPRAAGLALGAGWVLGTCLTLAWLFFCPAPAHAADVDKLSERIAASLQEIKDPKYRTVAFSRVRQAGSDLDIDTLIDFVNVKVVRGRRLRVIDRSK